MKRYKYVEPVPGLNVDGTPVTCCQEITIDEADVIKIQRYVMQKHYERNRSEKALNVGLQLTDEQLLHDFVVINWAQEVQ